jgi:hypothetical protein
MSTVFELDSKGWEQRVSDAQLSDFDANAALDATAGEGIFSGIGHGLARGAVKTLDTAMTVLGRAPAMSDEQERIQGIADELQDEQRKEALEFWTPSSRDVGTIGKVLGSFGEIAAPLMVSAGNPSLLMANAAIQGGKDLVNEGADATTATVSGVIDAAATGIGFKLPFLGKSLTSKMATGAGGNVLLGAGTAELQRELMTGRGFEELAQNYDPLDFESRAIDALTGLAFGGVDYALSPSQRIAVLAAGNAKHFQQDTAPGRPLDLNASVAHQKAMDTAMGQMLAGEPVSVPPDVLNAKFAERPARPEFDEQTWRDVFGEDMPKAPESVVDTEPARPMKVLDDSDIETRFAEQIAKDTEGQIAAYAKLPDSHGGRTINADLVRELSPDYLADRSRSGAVHEPASALTKEIYKRVLAEAEPGGEVVFAAGGAGSGKSTGLKILGLTNQIIYDGTMAKLATATKLIEQALEANQKARIVYTYRDPAESFKNGALSRSMREESEHGTGRTVPLDAFIEGHKGARDTIAKLMEKYKDDPRVSFNVIDNSRGPGEAKSVELADLPQRDYNGLREELRPILEEQRASGAISEAVYRGTAGKDGEGRVRPEVRGGPEQGRAREGSDEVGEFTSPVVDAVKALLAERDIPYATGEIDADGNSVVRSGRQVMAEAEANIQKAKQDGAGIEAAVSCFLTRGFDAP